MKHIRALKLTVLCAVLGLALVGAASASASQFRAEKYEAVVSGKQTTQVVATLSGGTLKCSTPGLSGGLVSASSSLPLTPAFSGCMAFGVKANVSPNSCQYVFNSTNEAAPFTGTLDVYCTKGGDAIVFDAPSLPCKVEIPAQSGRSASYTNTGINANRKIEAALNFSNLKYTKTGAGCPEGPGSYETGKVNGTYILSAEVEPESLIKNGLYLGKEQVAAEPKIRAEKYPVYFDSAYSGSTWFGLNPYMVTGSMRTEGSLSAASADVSLTPIFSGFTYFGNTVNVSTNGCSFKLHAISELAGTASLICPAGKEITLKATSSNCLVTLPAQSDIGGVKYENSGTGTGRIVYSTLGLSGLKYTATGSECGPNGTFENGKFSSVVRLQGHEGSTSGPAIGTWIE